MPPERAVLSAFGLVLRGIRRSPWRSLAGWLAALVGAGAFLAAAALFMGMERSLETGVAQLGADLVVAPASHRAAVERWLAEGEASPIPAEVPVAQWRHRMESGTLVGVREIAPWDLTAGGSGQPAAEPEASVLLVRLERWGQPMMVLPEIAGALPEAAVVVTEQITRRVAEDLQPLVRLVTTAAVAAWLGALLITGLLTAAQVAERRGELGMMRSVGASRRLLVGIMLGETGLLAAAGSVVGSLVGLVALALAPLELTALLTPADLGILTLTAVGLTTATALAAAAAPTLRTAWMDPLAAVQHGR